jgi:hypothetical protein
MKRHFTNAISSAVKAFRTALEPMNCTTVHDHKWPCAHWFRWKTLWASVVNFDLVNNKVSQILNRNVYCKCITSAVSNYYTVKEFIVECFFQLNSRTTPSRNLNYFLFWCEELTLEVCPSILDTLSSLSLPVFIFYFYCFLLSTIITMQQSWNLPASILQVILYRRFIKYNLILLLR